MSVLNNLTINKRIFLDVLFWGYLKEELPETLVAKMSLKVLYVIESESNVGYYKVTIQL